MVDPPELLQFLPGPWSRAHALEAGGTVRANTAWGDPAPTALKVFNIYTAPHRQAPVTLVTPRAVPSAHACVYIYIYIYIYVCGPVSNNLTTATTTTSASTAV